MKVTVFTDGASKGNPGPGGWGAIIATEKEVVELGGSENHTTNNRMELTAVIYSLAFVNESPSFSCDAIEIFTDSAYVLNGATKWIRGWRERNWITSQKTEVLNRDLWEELDRLLQTHLDIRFHKVSGHTGVPANERVDEIATRFADGARPMLFSGLRSTYPIDVSERVGANTQKTKRGKAYSYLSIVDGRLERHTTWADCERRVRGKSNARFRKALSKEDEAAIIKGWSL